MTAPKSYFNKGLQAILEILKANFVVGFVTDCFSVFEISMHGRVSFLS